MGMSLWVVALCLLLVANLGLFAVVLLLDRRDRA